MFINSLFTLIDMECTACRGSSSIHRCGRKNNKAGDEDINSRPRKRPRTESVEEALEWLTCEDQKLIRAGDGATLQSVKLLAKNMGFKIKSRGDVKEKLNARLMNEENVGLRREFVKLVKEISMQQGERQDKAALEAEAKRNERKKFNEAKRAERQARRDLIHHVLKSNATISIAVCPIVDCMYF